MRVHIEVTENDIKFGKPHTLSMCPVARAIRRTLPGSKALVGADKVALDRGSLFGRTPVKVPPKVFKFGERFDAGKTVEPMSFDLETS
jgi:hypothetical protein